ncbi:iron complex transport system substrate-binding protein [Arthrobacter alpinus]|uniref:Iron complex transport system substrate-binding protein n=1 Tax=Arthrobacter alpinus TaxID=656366 RepID=A0A1H5LJK5_9MICC|nr:ABC transporter substrate-binding protein [Arthrobacter alpinus]SEE76358.1 iron complex transport system substrate-binding protein [Arthrobacter alpinus]
MNKNPRTARRSANLTLVVASILALGLTLTGCNTATKASSESTASTAPASKVPVEAGAYPTTIAHAFGKAVIDKEPERVLTIGISSEDTVIALGVVPVAVPDETWAGDAEGYLPWFREAVADLGAEMPVTLNASDTGELDYEQILDLAPDLILAPYSDINDAAYKRLESIATTVAYANEPFGITSWQEQARIVGQALGRPAATETLIEGAETKLADAAAAHPEFKGKTFAYGMALNEGSTELGFYDKKDGRVTFTEQLGLTMDPDVAEISANRPKDLWYGAVSLEKLDTVTPDIFIAWGDDQATVDRSLANPLLAQWAPLKSGGDIWITDKELARATTSVSIISMGWALDRYVPLLADAIANTK